MTRREYESLIPMWSPADEANLTRRVRAVHQKCPWCDQCTQCGQAHLEGCRNPAVSTIPETPAADVG